MYLKERTDIFLSDETQIRLDSHRNIILEKNDIKQSIPIEKVGSFIVFGEYIVPHSVVKVCKDNSIDVSYISKNGKFTATTFFGFQKNVHIRVLQTKKHIDNHEKLSIAKKFVSGKILNANHLVKRVNGLYLKNFTTDNIPDIASLRGVEGSYAKSYYSTYGKLFISDEMKWKGRSKQPPKDEINALMGMLYTVLNSDIVNILNLCGLDPYIGYLHEEYYGRPSLACDFLEEFRSAFVDKFVLNLINRSEFKKEDFETKKIENKAVGTFITKKSMGKLFGKWSNWYRSDEKKYKRLSINCNRKTIVEKQIRHFIHYLTGDETEYYPFDTNDF